MEKFASDPTNIPLAWRKKDDPSLQRSIQLSAAYSILTHYYYKSALPQQSYAPFS
jgi:hypothetical protein